MKLISILILIVSSLLLTFDAYAHGGRLNSQGCHNNRKTGGYHCHRSQRSPSPPPVIKQENPKNENQDKEDEEDGDDGGGINFILAFSAEEYF